MGDPQSHAVKCLNTSSGRRRFVFKTFSQRVEEIDINVFRSLDPVKSQPSEGSSFFREALMYWRELNTAEHFISFFLEMLPSVQTLPQILLHKEKIFSELLSRLHMKAKLSLEPILMLIVSLSRDILEEFLLFLPRLADSLVDLLKNGGDHDPEVLEQVFKSLSYIMMHLQKYLVKDVVHVLRITTKLRFYQKDYVQEFMAEAVSFLLRNSSIHQLKKGIKMIIREVAKNPSPDRKNGATALLLNVMRGTSLKIHSRAEMVMQLLVNRSIFDADENCSEGSEAVFEVITGSILRLFEDIDQEDLNLVYDCLFQEIYGCLDVGCPTHLIRMLAFLGSVVRHTDRKMFLDRGRMLELLRFLMQAYIVPLESSNTEDHQLEVVNKIVQLMLCFLDVPSISSDISSILPVYAPTFQLKNSGLMTFVKGLVQKGRPIINIFGNRIISSLDYLIEASPDEVLRLILTFLEKQGEGHSCDILANVSGDMVEKICQFFEETLSSWATLIKDLTSDADQTENKFNESKLAMLWGVIRCYSHFQHQGNGKSSMQNFISNLDHLLETKADIIAGLSKSVWKGLLGAALESYHNLLLVGNSRLAEARSFLDFAKNHKDSPQVLFAVAGYLDSCMGEDDGTKSALKEMDGSEAVDVLNTFADNLSIANKSVRVSTLRILSHYASLKQQQSSTDEPPHKKLKTDEAGCYDKDLQYRVIKLLLSIETVPLSLSTSRKVIILISQLQMGLTSAKFHNEYLPLLLHGIIGILHNRFGYLWDPAVDCLSVLISKNKEHVWDGFVQILRNYQSEFLSSGDQLVKLNPENPKPNNLDDCFKLFLEPDSDCTPCMTVVSLLLKSLQKVPQLAESRSRHLIPLFLKFLGYDDDNVVRVELFSAHDCKGKVWRTILKEWLNVLKLMHNARSLYRNQVVKEVLMNRILDELDPDIQLKVLDCLFNWREDFLFPYEQHLKNLVISKNLREELTVWSVSKESQSIEERHRGYLIPVVIRLLMPKVRKLKTLTTHKNAGVNHRRAALCFLAQLDVDELHLFFSLLLKPLFASDHAISGQPEEYRDELHPEFSSLLSVGDLSFKKRYGFLHVVEDILKTFDEFHIRPFINMLTGIVVRVLESCMLNLSRANNQGFQLVGDVSLIDLQTREEQAIGPNFTRMDTTAKQYKDLRSLCLKIISIVLNKYDSHDFGAGFWDTFFRSVKPLIDSFKHEGSSSEKPSSLFSCFVAMSRSPTLVQLLHKEPNLIPTIFSILTVRTASDAIISSVLNFVENLLSLDSDLDPQDDDSLRRVLLLHIDALIHSLYVLSQTRRKGNRKSTLWSGKTEIRIFKLLVKYVKDPLTAGLFIEILLPLFKQKALDHDDFLEVMHVLKGILPFLTEKATIEVLNGLHPLLTHVGLDLRLYICDILDGLVLKDPSLVPLAKLLRQLNAVSSSEIGDLDYDTRVTAFESITPGLFRFLREDHSLLILSHCIYDMSSEELILRQSASKSLLSFIQFAAPILDTEIVDSSEILSNNGEEEDKMSIVVESKETRIAWTKACIQRIIKKIFLQNMAEAMTKDISVRKEWVALLREMVYNLKGEPTLSSFTLLCSEDAEVDFFNNVLHLQIHRRTRALVRFRNVASAGNLAEDITMKIFVPLFFNMLFEVRVGKEHLRNACVETLASISRQMQWESYRTFLMRCFREMTLKPDKQKIIVHLICTVLDKFHFSESKHGHEVKDGGEISVSSAGGMSMVESTNTSELNVPSHIQSYLQSSVLPRTLVLLTSNSEKVNVNVSLAALKLLKLLPGDIMDSQLPSVIHHISNFLKNRLESVRDEARHALAACAKELGVEYLQFIVKVLQATLKRGYELHVLGYTLNFILSHMLTDTTVGRIDYCLEELLSIAENDILGDVGEEKEVDKIASKMKEARKSRSYDTLKMIAERMMFQTHAMKVLSFVSKHVEKHLTPKRKGKIEMMLHHIASGIESNPSAHLEELLIFVYGLIEDGIHGEDPQGEPTYVTRITDNSSHELASKRNALSPRNHKLGSSHLFTVFALGVLHNRLKNMKLDKKELLSLLDPFIKLLGDCLNSKYEDVLSAAFKCLASMVRIPLPSLEPQAGKIKLLLLDIAQKSGNPNSTLVHSCLKLLTVLLQSGAISLSNDELHLLIQFPLFIDLETSPPIALSLLKSIIGRKLVVPEIYDIVIRVAEMMITSQSEPIRKKCSHILLRFFLDYRLSDKRLQQHMDFLLTSLRYEHCSGREAGLEMLHTVLIKFPKSVLDAQAPTFFFHLVVALANESDDKVQSMICTVLKELFNRTSEHVLQSILEYSLSWYTGGEQHLWSAAAQVLGLLAEQVKKLFPRHINRILDVTRTILKFSTDDCNEEYDASNGPGMPFWKEAYHSLVMLEKMLVNFPELYLDKQLVELWEMVCRLLLHPHVRLRNITSQLVALYFAAVSNSNRVNGDPTIGMPYLLNPSRLFVIAASMLNQLKTEVVDDAMNNIIMQNLVFSTCGLHSFAKQNDIPPHEFWSTLASLEQDSYLRGFDLLGSRKARSSFLLIISSAENKDQSQQNNINLRILLVVPILKRMGKVALQMEDSQTKIILNSLEKIVSQIGFEGCYQYASYILLLLYKVCEGFVGKVMSDEVKQLGEEVCGSIRNVLGVDNFVQTYNEIRKTVKGKRDKRRQKQKITAVTDPMRHAKRKLRIAAKHRAHKKRKIEAMKMKKWRR